MQSFWSRKGWANRLLLPFSWLFCALAWLRRRLYRNAVLASAHPGVPVIVAGNITVGGSGKTPFVIWLAQWLKTQGYHPGVVSRGYGRKTRHDLILNAQSTAVDAGDEPVLIHRSADVPVAVAASRLQACRKLLAAYPQIDILIADDGLQHYRLQRDLELVLADAAELFGNGWLLPAGPLREPLSRLRRADALILSQRGEAGKNADNAGFDNPGIPQFRVRHRPGVFRNLNEPGRVVSAEYFSGKRIEAVAGIARPEAFFSALEQAGMQISRHAFPDHHAYAEGELSPQATIVMTEKDAVKCHKLAGPDWWARSLEFVPDAALEKWLAAKLAKSARH